MAEKHGPLATHLIHFARTTSAHGYCRAAAASGFRSTVFWFLLLLTANLLFMILTYQVIQEYLDQYVPIGFEFSDEEFQYPELTVCAPFTFSLLKLARAEKAKNLTNYLGQNLTQKLMEASEYHNSSLNSNIVIISSGDAAKDLWTDFNDLVVNCYVGGLMQPCDKIYKVRCSHVPTCFTITINSSTIQTMNTLGSVYMTLFVESITHPLIPFRVATYANRIRTTYHTGLRLFVHPRRTRAWNFVREDLILSPGHHYDISLTRTVRKRVTSFFGKQRCIQNSERVETECPFYGQLRYTTPMCRSFELHRQIRRQCNCSLRIECGPKEAEASCFHLHSHERNMKCLNNEFRRYMFLAHHCLPACVEENYEKVVRSAPIAETNSYDLVQYLIKNMRKPSEAVGAPVLPNYILHMSKLINEHAEHNDLFIKLIKAVRKNFITLVMYFETGSTSLSREKYLISPLTLISNIGGCLGLWIGCSVISIVEFLDLFTGLFLMLLKRIRPPKTCTVFNGQSKPT